MLVLKLEAVAPSSRVAVDDEGETIDAGGIFFGRQRRSRRFDRAYLLSYRFRRQRRLPLDIRRLLLRILPRLPRLPRLRRCNREYAKQGMNRREKWFEHIFP